MLFRGVAGCVFEDACADFGINRRLVFDVAELFKSDTRVGDLYDPRKDQILVDGRTGDCRNDIVDPSFKPGGPLGE